MPAVSADFPQPFIRLMPDRAEMFEHGALEGPVFFPRLQSTSPCLVQRVHDLAEHIELKLPVRGIPDAYGRGAFVAGQPRDFVLRETSFTGQSVHDLQSRCPRRRAQQPISPRARLFEVASIHECQKGQRRVPEPAIAIVPIAGSAERSGKDVVGAATIPPVGA